MTEEKIMVIARILWKMIHDDSRLWAETSEKDREALRQIVEESVEV